MNVYMVKDVFRIVSLLESHLGMDESYCAEIITDGRANVLSAGGSTIVPDQVMSPNRSYELIVVPAMEGRLLSCVTDKQAVIVEWLKNVILSDTPILSLSTGAYFVAATGLADNVLLATHWAFVQKLKGLFPNCEFTSHSSYLLDKNIYTTGTLSALLDVLLAFISEAKGDRFAYECATHLLLSDPKEIHPILPGFRSHKDKGIYGVQDWIETNYQGVCLIESMAIKFGFSERNLKRRFQQATGISPNQYLQRVRIDKAKKLLIATNMLIKEISYQVGYQNDSFFSRAFKKHTGATPSKWRTSPIT